MESLLFLILLALAVAAVSYVLATGIYRVPPRRVGIVYRRFGRTNPDDRNFKLVRAHGSPGYQAETLDPDRTYLRPRPLYQVKYVERIVVPPGTIGVVVAKDGAPPPVTQTLGTYVECENFENGRQFLLGGGQKGRQPGVLPGDASYAINTELFDVITVNTIEVGRHDLTAADLNEVTIPGGVTGVVVVYAGKSADENETKVGRVVPGHESFQLPWEFLGNDGQRGVQEETLSRGGVYRINPWFAQVVLVPTRVIVLEWTKKDEKPAGSFDKKLDQIRINVEGHWLRFDMTQTIRITAKAAPLLVSRFGDRDAGAERGNLSVQRFVGNVLRPLVEGYFQRVAGDREVLSFVADADGVRTDLARQVRDALEPWNIEAIDTALGDFEPEEATLDEFRRRLAEQRDKRRELQYEEQNLVQRRKNTEIEEDIKGRQLRTEEERRRKLAVAELQGQIDLLGRDNVAMQGFIAELVKAKVPQVVAGNAESLLGHLSLPVAQEMIGKVFRRVELGREYDSQPLNGPVLRHVLPSVPPGSGHKLTIYTSSDGGAELKRELVDALDEFGLELVVDESPVPGSSLQRGWVTAKEVAQSEAAETASRIQELEKVLKLHAVGRKAAEIAKTWAVQALLDAVDRQESMTIRLGSLFIVKASNQVAVCAVSEPESAELEEKDDLAASPIDIFEHVKSCGTVFLISR